MPAPTIDTQGPLNRRKALIAKLMAQMQGQGVPMQGGPQVNAPALSPTRTRTLPTPATSTAGGVPVRRGEEGRGRAIAGLLAPLFSAASETVAERPPDWQPVPEREPDPIPEPYYAPAPEDPYVDPLADPYTVIGGGYTPRKNTGLFA